MSTYQTADSRKVTIRRSLEMKEHGERVPMLTVYDYSTAQIIDTAGMDVVLVGGSASNVMAGNMTALPITFDQMMYRSKSMMRTV